MEKGKTNISLNETLAILPIRAVSKALNVHQTTLRIYDRAGILTPARSKKNTRYYSLNDLEKAKAILFLTRNLSLNLAGVKMVFAVMEQSKIKPMEYMEFLEKTAKRAKIGTEQQKANVKKNKKRGRKSS